MNIFLHPVSYKDNTNNIITNIQPFMFTNNNIMSFYSHNVFSDNNGQKKNCLKNDKKDLKDLNINSFKKDLKNKELESSVFYPLDKDSLFWCLYIMKYGIDTYNLLSNRNFVTEKKIKIEFVESSRKNKHLLKQYKFSSILDFENMLVNEYIIHVNTFLSLCVLENINVIVIYKRDYLELLTNDSNIIYVIFFNPHKSKYGFKTVNHEWCSMFIKTNYNKVEKINI
jgi:hypothetical protein